MSNTTSKAVFLSYTSQDTEVARGIAEALQAAGIEVWFDRAELRGGDAWDQKIRRQIRECALFVPIISANTQARPEGYFRLEWHLAEQRSLLIARGLPFIMPVCMDETKERDALVPEAFLAVQWTRLPAGAITPAFAAHVKRLLTGGATPVGSGSPGIGGGLAQAVARSPTRTGAPVIPDFELVRQIGQGSYGDVWLARGLTGVHRAIKIVWRDRFASAEPFEREFNGLKKFSAMTLPEASQLALLHVGQNEAAGFFYYVMELADDVDTGREVNPAKYVPLTLKEVRARRGRLPAKECVTLGVELARALAGLHERGLVHRDIKPSNIILVGGVPKLADIGLVAETSDALTCVGTEGFVPPEGPGKPTADVFALGKMLYELATGIDREDYPRLPPELARMPDRKLLFALNDIILRCCEPVPGQRYADASALLADLREVEAGHPRRHRPVRALGRNLAAALAVITVVAAGAGLWWKSRSVPSGKPEDSAKSIAVLPFQVQRENQDDVYLADGILEDVVTSLAGVRGLKITALPSVLRYRGTKKPLPQVGQELGVAHLLTGSLRRAGNQIRVSTQLIEARTERQVWAKSFDRELTNALALQGDIAREIVPALQLTLSPDESRTVQSAPTLSSSAYDLYLKARNIHEPGAPFSGPQSTGLLAAKEELLQKAVADDPNFVRAWVELAATHTDRYFHDPAERNAARIARAEEAIAVARRLAPNSPEVLLGQGRIRYYCYQDYPGAEYFYHKVLAEYPNYPGIHLNLGLLYRRQGRWAQVILEFRRALAEEPGNGFLSGNLAFNYLFTHRYEDAYSLQAKSVSANPNSPEALSFFKFMVFRRTGSTREYEEWWARIPEEKKRTEEYLSLRLFWLANTGNAAGLREMVLRHGSTLELMDNLIALDRNDDRAALERILAGLKPEIDRLLALDPVSGQHWLYLSKYHALRGEKPEALKALETSAQVFPESRDAINGPGQAVDRAMVLVWLGELDSAMAEVRRLLRKPSSMHAWMLQHRVAWAGLKVHPDWRRVVDDPANSSPLVTDGDLAVAEQSARQ